MISRWCCISAIFSGQKEPERCTRSRSSRFADDIHRSGEAISEFFLARRRAALHPRECSASRKIAERSMQYTASEVSQNLTRPPSIALCVSQCLAANEFGRESIESDFHSTPTSNLQRSPEREEPPSIQDPKRSEGRTTRGGCSLVGLGSGPLGERVGESAATARLKEEKGKGVSDEEEEERGGEAMYLAVLVPRPEERERKRGEDTSVRVKERRELRAAYMKIPAPHEAWGHSLLSRLILPSEST